MEGISRADFWQMAAMVAVDAGYLNDYR